MPQVGDVVLLVDGTGRMVLRSAVRELRATQGRSATRPERNRIGSCCCYMHLGVVVQCGKRSDCGRGGASTTNHFPEAGLEEPLLEVCLLGGGAPVADLVFGQDVDERML